MIRENQPVELPAGVFRSSDKPDLGLEELQQLNVKERFQVFESGAFDNTPEPALERSTSGVKRSTSILSKLARFQGKGGDVGVNDDSLNGDKLERSSTDEDEDDDENEDIDLIRAKRIQKERPMSFSNMNEMKDRFESGHVSKEDRREERKQEIQHIRSRLFHGKQARIKEMYQQAVHDSEFSSLSSERKPDIEIGDKAKSIMERFEKGEAFKSDKEEEGLNQNQINEEAVFEHGISKKSRSIFLEMDATTAKNPSFSNSVSPRTPEPRKISQVSSLVSQKSKVYTNALLLKF